MESSTSNKEELLSDKLEKAVVDYYQIYCVENQQILLQVLRTNDCRGMIAKSIDGDKFSDAFVATGTYSHSELSQAFLDQGMNADVKDQFGDTALINASNYSHKEIIPLLLDHNANPDVQDSNGWTALMYASAYGSKEIVQLLLNHNADVDLKNDAGNTALDLAKTDEIKEMIQNHVNTSYVLK